MEDFKAYCKRSYKCGICDKEYETIQERMNCEMACYARKQEEDKEAERVKKEAERNADFEEASSALDNALALVNKCVEKHGFFKYSGKVDDLDLVNMDFFPSKLWHYFWF